MQVTLVVIMKQPGSDSDRIWAWRHSDLNQANQSYRDDTCCDSTANDYSLPVHQMQLGQVSSVSYIMVHT